MCSLIFLALFFFPHLKFLFGYPCKVFIWELLIVLFCFRGNGYSKRLQFVSLTSNLTSTSLRGTCFALKGEDGTSTLPISGEDGILSYSKTGSLIDQFNSVIAETENNLLSNTKLQPDALSLGAVATGMAHATEEFFAENGELDLDCSTEGFSSIQEAIEDIRQGKVCY